MIMLSFHTTSRPNNFHSVIIVSPTLDQWCGTLPVRRVRCLLATALVAIATRPRQFLRDVAPSVSTILF